MTTTITATELSKNLSDILNRVKYRGEQFVIERNGEAVANISPASPSRGDTFGRDHREHCRFKDAWRRFRR